MIANMVIANKIKLHLKTSERIFELSFKAKEVVIFPKSKLIQGIYIPQIKPQIDPIIISPFLSLTNSNILFESNFMSSSLS